MPITGERCLRLSIGAGIARLAVGIARLGVVIDLTVFVAERSADYLAR